MMPEFIRPRKLKLPHDLFSWVTGREGTSILSPRERRHENGEGLSLSLHWVWARKAHVFHCYRPSPGKKKGNVNVFSPAWLIGLNKGGEPFLLYLLKIISSSCHHTLGRTLALIVYLCCLSLGRRRVILVSLVYHTLLYIQKQ